jgi:hypothetical protein
MCITSNRDFSKFLPRTPVVRKFFIPGSEADNSGEVRWLGALWEVAVGFGRLSFVLLSDFDREYKAATKVWGGAS